MTSLRLQQLMSSVAERGRSLVHLERNRRLTEQDPAVLAEALLSGRGEASGMAIAQQLLRSFASLDAAGKSAFFQVLIESFGPNPERVEKAIAAYRKHPGDRTLRELHEAAEPRRQELIRRLNLAPGGTTALVAMRTEVLDRLAGDPGLDALDHDFHHLLSSWFNRGFLSMSRVEWATPASVLAKIIQYEAVHRIRDWDDLRGRIEPADRRCYAFFHPALVDEPLIFVEVALSAETPDAIAPILAEQRKPIAPQKATTAVFYSISNCQRGLRGVSFGNFLIKQVVEDLSRDLPNLKTFVTLSPVPGFMPWLRGALADRQLGFLGRAEREHLALLDDPAWVDDRQQTAALKKLLAPLAAHYFLAARTASGKTIDPVARFHLGNGARLQRINWLGDVSARGMKQSAGLMVNYLYDVPNIERNHEAFVNRGEVVASRAVTGLLKHLPSGDDDE